MASMSLLITSLQEFFNTKYQEELDAHPELQELEEGGNAGSSAPSASAGTPQPTSATRIKLISSSSKEAANGGTTTTQSDDE